MNKVMNSDELIEQLADSFVNGNISHVIEVIEKLSKKTTAFIAVGVFEHISDYHARPSIATSFLKALENKALN